MPNETNSLKDIDPKTLHFVSRLPTFLAILVFILSILVFLGWIINFPLFKSVMESWVSMKANAAIGLALLSIALYQLSFNDRKSKNKLTCRFLSLLAILLGAVTLYEYVTNAHLSIDVIFFQEQSGTVGTSHPGRMSPVTAISLMLIGFSFYLTDYKTKLGHPFSHYLAAIVGFNSITVLLGYLYRAEKVYGIANYTQMAFLTALCFAALALGIFSINLNQSFFTFLVSKGPAGIVARIITLAGVSVPIVLGFIRVLGERAGLYPMEVGAAAYGTGIIIIFIAVAWWTAQVVEKAEEERIALVRQQEKSKVETELRDKFISMLAHDLRTPLTAAKVSAEMIERKPENANLNKSYAKKINAFIGRSDRMIQDLLDIKRITEGHSLNLKPDYSNIRELCRETVSELSLVHGNRFVIKSEEVDGHWNSISVRRLLENLLSNAAKYGSKDTPITINARKKGENLYLSVHNEGSEILEKDKSKLFLPYERLSSAEEGEKSGWGIGLTIVRATVEAHGGTISVDSSKSKGTTFNITLPIDARPFLTKKS